MYSQLIRKFIEQEVLPETYAIDAESWFVPLVEHIAARHRKDRSPLVVGITGAQGTGKSTLAKLISALLTKNGFRVTILSIDDFYLSRHARAQLAETVHPLLASRGVPGTHDTPLALSTLTALESAGAADQVLLPAFNKAEDDCVITDYWLKVNGPIDVILLEGWFVGASSMSDTELLNPVNELEQTEDKEGDWRRYVNQQLGLDYQTLFRRINELVMLQAPSFDKVFEWRGKQEEKLKNKIGNEAKGVMDSIELLRFIQHYERLTRHCLVTLPAQADVVFRLDNNHRVIERLTKTVKG